MIIPLPRQVHYTQPKHNLVSPAFKTREDPFTNTNVGLMSLENASPELQLAVDLIYLLECNENRSGNGVGRAGHCQKRLSGKDAACGHYLTVFARGPMIMAR